MKNRYADLASICYSPFNVTGSPLPVSLAAAPAPSDPSFEAERRTLRGPRCADWSNPELSCERHVHRPHALLHALRHLLLPRYLLKQVSPGLGLRQTFQSTGAAPCC